ncbi:MAG TPA: FecR domain-containing protein [Flavobacteriaceae bacterium]
MKTSGIQSIIIKFFNNEANIDELEQLEKWLQHKENETMFNHFVEVELLTAVSMGNYNVEKAKQLIKAKIDKAIRRKKLTMFSRVSIAASVIGILATAYFFKDNLFTAQSPEATPIIVNNQIKSGTDKATLTLEDGSEVVLEKGTTYQTPNATSNGEEIVYEAGEKATTEIAYNTLTIPRGGQFYIKLSDDTKIWLNSESQLKYPVSFTDGKTRQVELVYGEAYFEVSPSTEHSGSDFKVQHSKQEIQVLGTQFNIKAYKDETHVYTTLVEGKVAISASGKQQVLQPDQQSNLDIETGQLIIAPVDVFYEVSWKDGIFNFKGKALKDIMKTLSRWYDMDVVIKNKALETVTFTGVLRKNQPIVEILSAIRSTAINNYEIHDKTITIE